MSELEESAPAASSKSESSSLADVAIQRLQSIYSQDFSFENLSIDPIFGDIKMTITNVVKKYTADNPEIDNVDVIVRCCRPLIQNECTNAQNPKAKKKEFNTMIVKSTLSEVELKEIFELLKTTFFDLPFFDSLIADKLWLFLQHSNNIDITEQTTKRCVEKYYEVHTFDDPAKPERKIVLNQIRLVFKCCYVLVLGYHPLLRYYRWTTVDELVTNYPDFANLPDKQELLYLLAFRNIIRIALLIIPPQGNKQLLLNIGGRLEGSGNEYITGTGQKVCVTRRVAIYEQEGKVTCQKKKPKTNASSDPNRYQQHEYVSSNKVKKIKLGESDIQDMSRGTTLSSTMLAAHTNSFIGMIPSGFTPASLAHASYQNVLPSQPMAFQSLHPSALMQHQMTPHNNQHQQMINIATGMDHPTMYRQVPNPAVLTMAPIVDLKRQCTMEEWQKTLPLMQRNDTAKSYKSIFNSSDGTICRKMQVHPESHFFVELESNVEPDKGILAVNNGIRNGLLSDMATLFGPWER
mmetsp:Transcript_21785/g.29993  ORF Transcript_21785/g.29993 Transcript_21785/m.29993 type:complete len:520 (-) Transcript_21785:267-1826(-)